MSDLKELDERGLHEDRIGGCESNKVAKCLLICKEFP